MIDVQNLTVGYRNHLALKDVSVQFPTGCMCAIFGANGAGKSTLLKAIMGLLAHQKGAVVWQNLRRRDIAYLPQQADIDRSLPMSVLELTAMGLWYEMGFFRSFSSGQHKRVLAALARVNMLDFAQRPIHELSNGQFQRVLFARMLVQDAQFLLLDEPFNAIDENTTSALLNVLHEENKLGKAVIAVLHDKEQICLHFPNTLLIARENVAYGNTIDVLNHDNLQRANNLVQTHDNVV